MRRDSRLPDFSVVVWLRKTDKFSALRAANLPEAKRLAEALKGAARHSELVLLRIMSRVDGADSISIKDERRTKH